MISLSADISNFEGSYPGIFENVGVTNGADGLSTIVNPVATPFLSSKPPSLPLKSRLKGRLLTTPGQLKELIGEHCCPKAETHEIAKMNKLKQNFEIKSDKRFFEKWNLFTICLLVSKLFRQEL